MKNILTSGNIQYLHNFIFQLKHSINRIFSEAHYFFNSHFTYLSILVIGSIGTILFFLLEYFWRYNKPDFWRWKNRAIFKSIRLVLTLILLKGVMKIIK